MLVLFPFCAESVFAQDALCMNRMRSAKARPMACKFFLLNFAYPLVRLPDRLAQDCCGGSRGDSRGLCVRAAESGDLQERFARAREHPHKVALFGARLLGQVSPLFARSPARAEE